MERFAIPGVGALIIKEEQGVEHVLFQERWKECNPEEKGLLEIPAGKIRAYENIFDTLRREVKEETGLIVSDIYGEDRALIYENGKYRVINFSPFSCSQNLIGDYPIMVFTFICRADGALLNQSDESQNYKWISVLDLKKMIEADSHAFYPMHVSTLEKYLATKQ